MCRLFGLIADRPVTVVRSMLQASRSLTQQSARSHDGWGIGYYMAGVAVLHKEPVQASLSPQFADIARDSRSQLFVAHLRDRTIGAVAHENTHPFERANWLLAQQGGLGAAWHRRIKDEIGWTSVRGQTSGELLLAWLFQRASTLPPHQHEQAITATLRELCAAPAAIKSANLVLTTGEQLYAFRFAPTSMRSARSMFLGGEPVWWSPPSRSQATPRAGSHSITAPSSLRHTPGRSHAAPHGRW